MPSSAADRAAEYLRAIQAISGEAVAQTAPEGPEPLPWPVMASQVQVKPIGWLAKGFLLDGEYHLLAAPGGSYKSTVMLAVAGAVAAGQPVLGGFPVERPRPVIIVSEEDPADVIRNRLEAFIDGMGWDEAMVLDNTHILSLEGVSISNLQWQLHLEHVADALDVGLICMDPLADLLEGDKAETSNELARPVIKWLRRLTKAGRASLIIHHHVKESETRKGQERARGASAWANGARGVYSMAEKDNSLWLGCDKLSRAVKSKEPREVVLRTETEADNEAMWVSASLTLAHVPNDWRVPDPAELTPMEKSALEALLRERDDPPTYSKWSKVAAMSESTLSLARRRLLDLGFARSVEYGKHGTTPRFKYTITDVGMSRLGVTPMNANSTPIGVGPNGTPSNANNRPPKGGRAVRGDLGGPNGVAPNANANGHGGVGPGLDFWEPGPEPDPE